MPTAIVTHKDCILHDTGMHHPESKERLIAINKTLKEFKSKKIKVFSADEKVKKILGNKIVKEKIYKLFPQAFIGKKLNKSLLASIVFSNKKKLRNLEKIIHPRVRKEKKIFVKYYEDKIKSINTFNLLNYIEKKNKKAKLFFLIGADNLLKFHKWNNWKKIPKLAKIVIFPRQNFPIKSTKLISPKKLNKKDLIYIKSKKINISSSLIRKFW